jgi:hypothetical protein
LSKPGRDPVELLFLTQSSFAVRLEKVPRHYCTVLFSHQMISSGSSNLFSTERKTESTKLPVSAQALEI